MKEVHSYLKDALKAIARLEEFTAGKTLADYDSTGTRWLIERGLIIVGEALFYVRKMQPDVPIFNLNRIIATSHFIVHNYRCADAIQLFAIIHKHLPILKTEVQTLLESLEKPEQ